MRCHRIPTLGDSLSCEGRGVRLIGGGMELTGDEDTLLVFMDECGDHSAGKADPDFPLLLLAFVLVERRRYAAEVIPAVGRLKLDFWPHEGVNLHSRDIRKQLGDFSQFHHAPDRLRLMQAITGLIHVAPFELIISCFHKNSAEPDSTLLPYHEALQHGLRLIFKRAKLLEKISVTLIAEARGKREDRELVAWLSAHESADSDIPIRWVIRAKRDNVAGLQVADLCAYPAARHIIKPSAANPAFDVVRHHLVGWIENKKGGDV